MVAQSTATRISDDPAIQPLTERTIARCAVKVGSATICRARGLYGVINDCIAAETNGRSFFFETCGWRTVGNSGAILVRGDSAWNVPEPELTLVVNSRREIIGDCVGNDVSSRSIEGENPLYLPQAKIFNGCCALGPGIKLDEPCAMKDLAIHLEIIRGGTIAFDGDTRTSRMNRRIEDLVGYLFRETDFPVGVFLMTGTGIVPPENFSLSHGDRAVISVGEPVLENHVDSERL